MKDISEYVSYKQLKKSNKKQNNRQNQDNRKVVSKNAYRKLIRKMSRVKAHSLFMTAEMTMPGSIRNIVADTLDEFLVIRKRK